ncbi:MAG: multiheme c-type cytochrome [Planctomycetia bacterium]|nr:multiheme c-type cytochrome [Planctomycetia bacterium]
MFHTMTSPHRRGHGRLLATPLFSLSVVALALTAGLILPDAPYAQTALKFVEPQAERTSGPDPTAGEENLLAPLTGIPEAVASPEQRAAATQIKFSAPNTPTTLAAPVTKANEEDFADSATASTDALPAVVEEVSPAPAQATDAAAEAGPADEIGDQAENGLPANSIAKAPFDPIKENGEYFVDWQTPDAAIVFTGLLDGYIEPCGCAGMDRMKGGLSRRDTFLNELKAKNWPVLAVDAGQLCTGFGVQEELKFDMVMNAFRLMDYQAIGMGRNDLKFPAYFLLTFTAPPSISDQSRFVSANVGIYGFNKLYILPYKVIAVGKKRIGVTSVIFPSDELAHRDENILIEDPAKKLQEILPQLQAEKTDRNILIVHGTEAETLKLASQFPQFQFVITADSPSEPPAQPKTIGEQQMLIEPGEKGKFALVVGLYDSEENPVRYQRVALDSRYPSSPEVFRLMEEYQGILKTLITTKGYKGGLGMSLVDADKRHILGEFVGSEKCESCHEESYRVWKRSRHAVAWNSLTETAKPPRDFDPECISCHVVGWHGIENFPYAGGFVTEEKTPHLKQVGCESCHGPGSKHIEAELGDDEKLQESIRTAMRLGNDTRRVCFSCHDGDNSPDFDFEPYYKLIEHRELEE